VSGALRPALVAWPAPDVGAHLSGHDVLVCTVSLLATEQEAARLRSLLSPAEAERHASYTNDIVARRFAVGRGRLREVLGTALSVAPAQVPLRDGIHGKPALACGAVARPLWFSVAHCDELQLVALSRSADVGVDLERARAIEQWERLGDRVLDPVERAQLQRAVDAGEDAGRAFLRHWCRVEAELKAIGCGIAGLEAHRAGKRPFGLRLADLHELPLPADIAAAGGRYQAAVALCAPRVESAKQAVATDWTPDLLRSSRSA
jgi:phosphopantetheinyl transferase